LNIPDSAEYIDIARRFAKAVAGRTDEINEGRRIPADLAGEMADAGLFRLLVPESLGGAEIDHPAFVEIVRVFAQADASTAWCVNQNNIFATDSTRMPVETAREIWGDRRGIVTNGPPSSDTLAIPVEGGYRHSGHWDFSSGSSHATWLAARGPVEGRPGEVRTFMVPKSEATMLDTWGVNGLRGTASFSFEVKDLFVPEAHTYLESNSPSDPGPLYIIPKNAYFSAGFATISLALARTCLDDAIELAGKKVQFAMSTAMADLSTVHRQIGETESVLRSADAYLRESRLILWNSACERGELPMDERIDVRMASTYAIRQAAKVVDSAYEMFGSQAIFTRNPLQRRWQDMHVIAQQFQGRATNYETAGRHYLGLGEEDTRGL
jgi:alkylation response protein AidB-like acyl-CoA dehydrogenase